ncbi:SDR family oxidoreductase [Marinobacter sp. CA1]|uniref:SDR family oxidoreductase n=1 Tax=Marinobacter sp. CA1 TaxID=2817656 RepID=UPI001D06FAC2|nr:SDR family oxidoreductase [Marinobacter sp. CA1]UDL05295.1 SDR family oxidoreductase [Marinobacter sp. CA1]
MQLRDRTFLLLGGTGGIGRALIEPLQAAGARLVVASRSQPVLPLPDCDWVQLDLAAANLGAELARVSEQHPLIDGVIHCAGQNRFCRLDALAMADWQQLMAVNLTSAFAVSAHFVPRFRERGQGGMVFVGSTFGSIGFPGYSAYCATKFGLRGFTEALRRELADTPIDVLYVAPRATQTAMNPGAVDALNQALGNRVDPPETVARDIVDTMVRSQTRRYLGWPERFFVMLNGLLPRLVDQAMRRQLPVIQRFLMTEGSK